MIDIDNFWQRPALEEYLNTKQTEAQSWPEFAQFCRAEFTDLVFLDTFENGLKGEPFSSSIASRARHLLNVLNEIHKSIDIHTGGLNQRGMELRDNYFNRGDRSLFTDSSDTEKNDFRKELTFRLPNGVELECFFHGKISYHFYRLHHSWPPQLGEPLYIAYFGPKITKT